ncbi:MAG: acetyl-CoA carboxylase biotin carboxylase subunit family protein [Myxococcaceae bacterium]
MGSYLIQDPQHEYASQFIRLLWERYGHRPIGLFTRGPKERFYRRNECLPDSHFAAVYEWDGADVAQLCARIKSRHPDLQAVIPYSEETLELTAKMLPRLGLRWNSSDVLERFRKKAALKDRVRRVAPSVRINFTARVSSFEDARQLGDSLPAKFILKPDSGFGSRGVAIFRREELPRVEIFFACAPGSYVLEEFLEGTIYAVDGVVDEEGKPSIASVFSSGRRTLNGSPVVYGDGFLVHQDTPLFSELAAYAADVIRATELRRGPFHMEVMRDAQGPCLIEVGARLIGHSHAFTIERVHGGGLDLFGIAARAYLGLPMEPRVDFAQYNSVQAAKVYGASTEEGVVYAIDGSSSVEQMDSFDRWIVRPKVGTELHRTTDLFTVPYSAVLVSKRDGEPITNAANAVHSAMKIHCSGDLVQKIRVDGDRLASKVKNKLGWIAEQARRQFSEG